MRPKKTPAKLRPDQVRDIRENPQKLRALELASAHMVGVGAVYDIWKGATYKVEPAKQGR